jgi:hypothetical protein
MNLFQRNSHEALVVDIGSASVLLGLVEFTDGVGKLTQVNKFASPFTEFSQPHAAYKEVLAGAGALLSEFALRKKIGRHTPVFVFLPTLLHFSEMHQLHKEWEREEVITARTLNTLAEEAAKNVFEHRKNTIEELSGAQFITLEKHITHSRLNGYEIEHPLGKKAKIYDGKLFVSYTSNDILEGVRQTIEKALHTKNVSFHSGIFALFDILQGVYATHSNFLIINAGRELADFIFVSKDDITHLATVPTGERALLSVFAQALSIPLHEAETIIGLLIAGNANSTATERVEKGLDAVWLSLKEKLVTAQTEGVFPKRLPMSVCILGDKTMTFLLTECLKRGEKDGLLFGKSPEITFLSPAVFEKAITSSFGDTYTPLLIKALFAKKIISSIL